MTEDDDLPVLTQVLRTGGGGTPRFIPPLVIEPLLQDLDVRPVDDTSMTDSLIIGNEPVDQLAFVAEAPAPDHHVLDRPSVDLQAATDGADTFRLPHDHDLETGPSAAFIDGIDEPEVIATTTLDDPVDHASMEMAFSPPMAFEHSAEDLAALERRVRESVLDDLLARIDTELDARIAQAMHAEIETALAQLQGRLRAQLTDAMRDVVGRAVKEEITRLDPQTRSH